MRGWGIWTFPSFDKPLMSLFIMFKRLNIQYEKNNMFISPKRQCLGLNINWLSFLGNNSSFAKSTYGVNAEGYCLTTTQQSNLITFSRNNLWFNLTCRHIKLVLLIRTRLLIKQAELATGESYLEIQ